MGHTATMLLAAYFTKYCTRDRHKRCQTVAPSKPSRRGETGKKKKESRWLLNLVRPPSPRSALSSELWVTMLSSGASSSSELLTHIPPGTAQNEFNVTVVAYASDNLGATAVTSLGKDGSPLAFMSSPQDQVRLQNMRGRVSRSCTMQIWKGCPASNSSAVRTSIPQTTKRLTFDKISKGITHCRKRANPDVVTKAVARDGGPIPRSVRDSICSLENGTENIFVIVVALGVRRKRRETPVDILQVDIACSAAQGSRNLQQEQDQDNACSRYRTNIAPR